MSDDQANIRFSGFGRAGKLGNYGFNNVLLHSVYDFLNNFLVAFVAIGSFGDFLINVSVESFTLQRYWFLVTLGSVCDFW